MKVKVNPNRSKKSKISSVPLDAIDFAIDRIQEYIDFRENFDVDKASEVSPSNIEEKWAKFHEWFYAACQLVLFLKKRITLSKIMVVNFIKVTRFRLIL